MFAPDSYPDLAYIRRVSGGGSWASTWRRCTSGSAWDRRWRPVDLAFRVAQHLPCLRPRRAHGPRSYPLVPAGRMAGARGERFDGVEPACPAWGSSYSSSGSRRLRGLERRADPPGWSRLRGLRPLEYRTPSPMLDMELFRRNPVFVFSNLAASSTTMRPSCVLPAQPLPAGSAGPRSPGGGAGSLVPTGPHGDLLPFAGRCRIAWSLGPWPPRHGHDGHRPGDLRLPRPGNADRAYRPEPSCSSAWAIPCSLPPIRMR